MQIILADSDNRQLAKVSSWDNANVAAKALFKKQYWSDLYYSIVFDDGNEISGSIDLEPQSFHAPHQNQIVTWHLKTFWGNISRAKLPRFPLTQQDIDECKKLLTYLPTN